MKYLITKTVFVILFVCCLNDTFGQATNITNGDGSPLTTKFCCVDTNYLILGVPEGGTFTGDGIVQENGQWYFNPVVATADISLFPVAISITYTAPSGHTVSRNITVGKPVIIDPPLQDTFTCNGHFHLWAHTLIAGAYDYTWTPGAPLERPDTSVTDGYITETTTFVLVAFDQYAGFTHCWGTDTITVVKHPVPEVIVSNDTLIKARESVQLQASGAMYYQWYPSKWLNNDTISNPIATPQAPTTYFVVGTNEFGCADTSEVFIDISEGIFIPNAFTPNGDGVNDEFKIENIGYQGIVMFKVFNRWGQEVFSTTDGTKGWDGTFKDKPAQADTYAYIIRLAPRDGTIQEYKGDVLLIR
jgi:gliding motility-associated-like protein